MLVLFLVGDKGLCVLELPFLWGMSDLTVLVMK